MTIRVRPGVFEDAAVIARINVASWRAAYRGIVSDDFLARISVGARERAWRERILGDPTRPVFVAERDDTVIGYCALAAPSRDEDAAPGVAELAAIYVDPDRWRSGAGTSLMRTGLASRNIVGVRGQCSRPRVL